MDKHTVIGIDLAKRSVQICAVNTRNRGFNLLGAVLNHSNQIIVATKNNIAM